MKTFYTILSMILVSAMLLACGTGTVSSGTVSSSEKSSAVNTSSSGTSKADYSDTDTSALNDPTDSEKENIGDFSIVSDSSSAVIETAGSVYTIRSAGEYTVTGALADGQIVVNAGDDDEVVLILSDASISCSSSAPILILNAGEATVKSDSDTYNTVTDLRTGDASALDESEENYDAAIFSDCDLKITGKGTLIVSTAYDNGIKSKDDLSVKNVTLKVTAVGNALKGNDSVEIKSGDLILISTESDGIKTVNSDISSKGNQRGTVSILGGHVDIYSACDGISAAYNVEISDEESCVVNIYTSAYSNEASSASEQYLIVPYSLYSDEYDYYAYLYNEDDSSGIWAKCTFETMVSGGRNATYYGLAYSASSSYQNILFVLVASGTEPDGFNQSASTGGETRNSSMNGYLITGISGSSVTGDWVQLSDGSGSSGKTAYSSKGIKAANEISVSGGAVTVYAGDDGLHANSGDTLENGSVGIGNITVSGGIITVTCADDGIHADNTLLISDGTVTVVDSHEGLEANVICLAGGTITVYADDDGLNACSGSATPLINITGGVIDVTTPSGDTDAVDSNGNVTISGGTVLIKGGASGGMAGSVDVDGSVTVTGGTVFAFGGICSVPSGNSVNVYISSGTSFQAGSYTLTDSNGNAISTFTLPSSYSSVWIASDKLKLNESYRLVKDGSEVLSWTQSSSTEGSSGYFGGQGGFGGGQGGFGGGRGGFGGRR